MQSNRTNAERLLNLTASFAALLEREGQISKDALISLIESVQIIQGETSDKRVQRLTAHLKQIVERFDLLTQIVQGDYLTKIRREAEEINRHIVDSRATKVLSGLLEKHHSLKSFCRELLDGVLSITNAERGLLLTYYCASTEAEVIASTNYKTTNLSLAEFEFSRTLLREIFERGEALLIEDALEDSRFSKQESVRRLELKSVIAIPLKYENRVVGALYFENSSMPCAFDKSDVETLKTISRFAVFYLRHAHLLPIYETSRQEPRVFFNHSKAAQEIVGHDPKILQILDVITRIADSPATVLIEGESGTGKELIARALHYESSKRANAPFVAINCAAIPENLLESELFGHEKGAFTGANEKRIGYIEQADGGTLFLDEVSELAMPLQSKLLRFLQANEFQRLGGRETLRVDVRALAATSKDLKEMVAVNKFQKALYFRLNVIPLLIPPLRERKEDIPLLIDRFLERFSTLYGKKIIIESEVYDCLQEQTFSGNVRELENLIHRLVVLSVEDSVRLGDLPNEFLQIQTTRLNLEKDPLYKILATPLLDMEDLKRRRIEVQQVLKEQELDLIERTIKESDGNLTEAANRLGLHRVTLHKLLKNNSQVEM